MKMTKTQIGALVAGVTLVGAGAAKIISNLNKEKKFKKANENYKAVLGEQTKDYTPEQLQDWLQRLSDAQEGFFEAIV